MVSDILNLATQVLEGMLGMRASSRVKRDDRGITNYDIRSVGGESEEEIGSYREYSEAQTEGMVRKTNVYVIQNRHIFQ
mgnify:CR=1 FL=1